MPDDHASPDYARLHGWDRQYTVFAPPEIPQYTGAVTFCKRPFLDDREALLQRAADVAIVGAPFDDAVSYRPGARFGPRAIRQATYNQGGHSLQLGVQPFKVLDVVDAGDANVVPAWLELGVEPEPGGGSRYHQRAIFHPRGLAGHLYWKAITPFHAIVFGGMVRNIVGTAERQAPVATTGDTH
jgi:hypothetical protein